MPYWFQASSFAEGISAQHRSKGQKGSLAMSVPRRHMGRHMEVEWAILRRQESLPIPGHQVELSMRALLPNTGPNSTGWE
jgi:hypothetical protein